MLCADLVLPLPAPASCLPHLPALSASGPQAGWTPSQGFESLEPVEQLGNWAQKGQRSVPLMLPERLAPSPSCDPRNFILSEPRLAEEAVGGSPGIMGMALAQARLKARARGLQG